MALTFLFWLSLILLLPFTVVIAIFNLNANWWLLLAMFCAGCWAYRYYLMRQYKKAAELQHVSLKQLMKKAEFTVYAPDAYNAQQAEQSICMQLNDLKNRMVAVAPGLAEQQVYDFET